MSLFHSMEIELGIRIEVFLSEALQHFSLYLKAGSGQFHQLTQSFKEISLISSQVRLRKGLSAADEFSVLVHELAHEKLHKNRDDMPKTAI